MSDTPIPAATLILMREADHGPPEVLMVERSRALAFAGGALVFPGGRVDPGDVALARRLAPEASDEAAARIAAIRETIEEVGIAVGVDSLPADARAALHRGVPIGELAGDSIALDALVPFARWLPAIPHSRIFDTRFYLTRMPEGAGDPVIDGAETVDAFWMAPRDVLARADGGQATLIYPTRRNLERLGTYGSYADAVVDAIRHPVRTITPWTETRDGVESICIPDDAGYPVTAEPVRSAVRA